ncbi:hypothetical protein GC098_16460 [Paenibacillus sp. LMG 31458]|uniref:Uncharacterized protein n=1 Tax=Paenibacillus phytorum TaxID=2654977 RepID=A0ABX1XZ72_9BACL|nr:hypothetical protein [Paenibacillus phytorum]NOU72994.1 hypothetical protein [Paenibacillus phytorum]
MRIQFLLAVVLLVSPLQGNIANATTPADIKIQGAPTEEVLKDSLFALLIRGLRRPLPSIGQLVSLLTVGERALNYEEGITHRLINVE